jgi:hypothetical protein
MWLSNSKLTGNDKSLKLNYISNSEGVSLHINHEVFPSIGRPEGSCEDEFKLLSFIWMFKVYTDDEIAEAALCWGY